LYYIWIRPNIACIQKRRACVKHIYRFWLILKVIFEPLLYYIQKNRTDFVHLYLDSEKWLFKLLFIYDIFGNTLHVTLHEEQKSIPLTHQNITEPKKNKTFIVYLAFSATLCMILSDWLLRWSLAVFFLILNFLCNNIIWDIQRMTLYENYWH
jgi:hypothetical protein